MGICISSTKSKPKGEDATQDQSKTRDQSGLCQGPCLMIYHGNQKGKNLTLYNVSQRKHHTTFFPECANKATFGSQGEWILAQDRKDPSDCCIFNAVTMEKIQVPALGERDLNQCSTFLLYGTLAADIARCIVFVITSRSIFYCKIGADQFNKQDLTVFHRCLSQAVTIFQGMMYYIEDGNYTLNCAQLEDSLPLKFEKCINGHNLKDQLMFYNYCTHLFGSCDHLYFVNGRLLDMGMMEFEIFRADLTGKVWEKVNDIGIDRALFLDHRYRGFSATVPPGGSLKGNCIYYSSEIDPWDNNNNMDLFSYDLGDGSVKVLPPIPFKIHGKKYIGLTLIQKNVRV